MALKEVDWSEVKLNPSELFGKDTMVLAAGTERQGIAAMTIGWGALGTTWEGGVPRRPMPTATVYVRPSRHTKLLMDTQHYFTIATLPGREGKRALRYLGRVSAYDEPDKVAASGLTPTYLGRTVYFAESGLVLVCRKLYAAPLVEEGFVDGSIVRGTYPDRDFHTMYVGQIQKVLSV